MLNIYKTFEEQLLELDSMEKGCWVHMTNPEEDEILRVSEALVLEPGLLRTALDEEERAHIEYEDGTTMIIVDIPTVTAEGKSFVYSTLPIGIIFNEDAIVTVCLQETPVVNDFIEGRVRGFYTFKKTRFVLQMLYRNATKFLQYLRQIDKASGRVQNELHKSMKNKELIQLLSLEKSLVYFSTSLTSNEMVLDKMLKMDYVKKYQDDTELLEDVIVENKQAIEMCNIYRDILSGTMDAFASVISNNLNIVMKFLAALTIVFSAPTLIASLWGMNVGGVPFAQTSVGFYVVTSFALLASVLSILFLKRRQMM